MMTDRAMKVLMAIIASILCKKNFSSRLEYHLTNLTRQIFFRHFLPKSEHFEHARHGRDFGRSV